MDPDLRRLFNTAYAPAVYERFKARLHDEVGMGTSFRVAETPYFLTNELSAALCQAAREILAELSQPGLAAKLAHFVPERWNTPGQGELPGLALVDLAIAENEAGEIVPRLIELQAFPTVFAFKVLFARVWQELLAEIPGMPHTTAYFSGHDERSFREFFSRVVLAGNDPEHVFLVDVDPLKQKTLPDFRATEALFGVRTVCVSDLIQRGDELVARVDGREVPVRRLYNRVVFDELEGHAKQPGFDYRAPLDVTWIPHPNWYWLWSKVAIPHLRHPAVPHTRLLSELEAYPDDLGKYVLKPLFSFAGLGVNVDPTRADCEAIPRAQRNDWCLQEKVTYAPALESVDGYRVKAEIRMMCLREPEGTMFEPVLNLVRLSRGKMIGVDFNKDLEWVGSSIGLTRQDA
ncbi:MAG: hypothetical protein H6834_11980 [Planctomycetes bacterium]|nr:hypothetical protein [Planctomycetota bacterium]